MLKFCSVLYNCIHLNTFLNTVEYSFPNNLTPALASSMLEGSARDVWTIRSNLGSHALTTRETMLFLLVPLQVCKRRTRRRGMIWPGIAPRHTAWTDQTQGDFFIVKKKAVRLVLTLLSHAVQVVLSMTGFPRPGYPQICSS